MTREKKDATLSRKAINVVKKEKVWEPETDSETGEEEKNQTVPFVSRKVGLEGVRRRKQEVTAAVMPCLLPA